MEVVMPEEIYTKGYLEYDAGILTDPNVLDAAIWSDGYLTFSTTEKRLERKTDLPLMMQILTGQPIDFSGYEGPLMEIHLWGDVNGDYAEICVEREPDNAFFFQKYVLHTQMTGEPNCYYRQTSCRSVSSIFPGWRRVWEVTMWQHRLNVFITRGGEKND